MKKYTEQQLSESISSLREYMTMLEGGQVDQSIANKVGQGVGAGVGTAAAIPRAAYDATQWLGDKASQGWNAVKHGAQELGQGIQQGWNATSPAQLLGLNSGGGQPANTKPVIGQPTPPKPVVANPVAKPDPAVQKIQQDLIAKGYPLKADGIMGPKTQKAVEYDKINQGRPLAPAQGSGVPQAQPTPSNLAPAASAAITPNIQTPVAETRVYENSAAELKAYMEILSEGMVGSALGAASKYAKAASAGLKGTKFTPQTVDPVTKRFSAISQGEKNAHAIGRGIHDNPEAVKMAGKVAGGVAGAAAGVATVNSLLSGSEWENGSTIGDDWGTHAPKNPSQLNPKVKEAQQILIKFGYLPAGADDGIMGPATKKAQQEFKTAYETGPQPVNPTAAPTMEHVSYGEADSLARIIHLAGR